MKLFKNVDIFDPKTPLDRLLGILLIPFTIVVAFVGFMFLAFYFIFGGFILDGIYYIATGDTIVWKHLYDLQ